MIKVIVLGLLLVGVVNLTDVTYYEILGISKQASTQEIRQAYKKLAVKYHPDKNPGAAKQEKFLKITEAYETLKDPEKRRNYDIYGSYPSYSRKYDSKSQSEYDNLYYNGLYHNDPFVDTLSGAGFYNYLNEGFHFINFYSPFCPPCQNVAEHWKKLAEIYKGIVKIAAVNCKYHNSFCYNSMRIGSYPSLLFYPNGKNGHYIYYRGDRTLEAMDHFVMSYVKSKIHVPTVTQLRGTDKPIAYVLGTNRVDRNALTRIAYQLNGLVIVTIVENDNLREKLTDNEYTTVVFKYIATTKDIESMDEKIIVKEIVDALPHVEMIDPDKLKDIRRKLRSGSKTPWVFYFSTKGHDKLQLYQMQSAFPHVNFGEVDCDKWGELCASLQVEDAPAWGAVGRGGGYQRAHTQPVREFITTAVEATRLHTLSASDFNNILDGDVGLWVLLVVPYKLSWEDLVEPFTRASLLFNDDDDINFGIMVCTLNTDKYCRQVAHSEPTVLIQNGTRQTFFKGQLTEKKLLEFVRMLRDSVDLELNEQQVMEILDPSGREKTWLVGFLPAKCGSYCDELMYEWLRVADKVRPLEFVRVGVLRCARSDAGFCANVRTATARLYPLASGHHYSVSLQHLSQAPYILEWAMQYIDDSVQKLNWNSFTKTVIAEELNPSSGKKAWLVYFHSPRCYRCYEMYADFAIAGNLLNNAVHLGKVNCLNERGLCQHEQVNSYPSLKLYLGRNQQQRFSSVVNLEVRDYRSIMEEIKPHLLKYDKNLLSGLNLLGKPFHDEF